MKKIILLVLILLVNCASTFALDIVYPKKNPVTINANSTFFIGSTNPTDSLKINDIDVEVHENGAFAQAVPLKPGKNEFKIISTPREFAPQKKVQGKLVAPDDVADNEEFSSSLRVKPSTPLGKAEIINFVIEKPQPSTKTYTPPALMEYPVMGGFYTKADNVPLRATPIDGGINRMSHLPRDTRLLINGEKNGFYRVYLNSKTAGWIDKSNVEQKDLDEKNAGAGQIKLNHAKCHSTKEFYIYEFEFEKKIPFALREENGLTLDLFNVQGEEDSTLTLNIPAPKLIGYDAFWEGEKFILKIRRAPILNSKRPLKDITIVVDAGHGGSEAGAIGCCGDKEKDINLAIAKDLEQELVSRGANVVMTRREDFDVALQDRVKIATENNAAMLISIHANAIPDGSDPITNRGTSVYYYHNQAKPLAESILSSMTTELCTQNDKVRQGSLALVRPTSAVSVLIEVAYIINPDDYALLTDKDFQARCAASIANGVEAYILKN